MPKLHEHPDHCQPPSVRPWSTTVGRMRGLACDCADPKAAATPSSGSRRAGSSSGILSPRTARRERARRRPRAHHHRLSGADPVLITGDPAVVGAVVQVLVARLEGAPRGQVLELVRTPEPPAPDAAAASGPGRGVATLPQPTSCARVGCHQPLPPRERQRGSRRRFCSPRCRWMDYSARHPRVPRLDGAEPRP